MEFIIILLIVFFVSIVFSIVGLGGAIIYVPLFYWLGIPFEIAIPTALLLNCITAGSASVTYYKEKMIALGFASPLIITSVLFAPLGAYTYQFLNDNIILALFAVVLTIAGIRMFLPFKPKLMTPTSTNKTILIAGISGMVIGFAAGLLGLGGGVFAIPLLLLIGFKAKTASATSAVFVFFTSLSGLLGHVGIGNIDSDIMVYTGIAAFVGAQIGSRIMVSHVESKTILKILGIVLLIMAAKIIYNLT
ncbi:MAG: sulfite exporter TauE/SafE family protein [Methanosarcinales archaeon]|nr:sulfite exporter TauE/SafE family protein [Methanosarcinales archaeon]